MFDKKLLNGKNIVITGGGTGLGKSMAARFVELGANIAITSRKNEVINSAAKELKKGRAKVIAQRLLTTARETRLLCVL